MSNPGLLFKEAALRVCGEVPARFVAQEDWLEASGDGFRVLITTNLNLVGDLIVQVEAGTGYKHLPKAVESALGPMVHSVHHSGGWQWRVAQIVLKSA